MSVRDSAEKTQRVESTQIVRVGTLKPQPGGGALRHGNPGNVGGGRHPDAFRALCRELACSGAKAAATVLANPMHPAYIGALKWASDHGYGKAVESKVIQGTLRVIVERDG